MLCPNCKAVDLNEVTKQGVLIDVCPQCRGVWLDRGELEKLLTVARTAYPDYDQTYGERHMPHYETHPHGHGYGHDYHKHKKHHKKTIFHLLEDIFD